MSSKDLLNSKRVKWLLKSCHASLSPLLNLCLIYSLRNLWRMWALNRKKSLKLHMGCGKVKIPGWINIDITWGADLYLDISKSLPFRDGIADFIYSEHVIEHLSRSEGKGFLKECHRCLRPGGVLRVATPDLDSLIEKYQTDWHDQDWLHWPEYQWIQTRGEMLNVSFSWWGHKYLYNEEDLMSDLQSAGFNSKDIQRVQRRVSRFTDLADLETRLDSTLVLEAHKT